MKTLTTLAAGYFLPTFLNALAQHPGALDMLVGVLLGLLAGLLVALVMVKPAERQPAAIAQPAQRQPRRTVQATKPRYTFTPINYEWSVA